MLKCSFKLRGNVQKDMITLRCARQLFCLKLSVLILHPPHNNAEADRPVESQVNADGAYVLKPSVNTLETGNAGNNQKQSIGNQPHIIKRTKSLRHLAAIYNART